MIKEASNDIKENTSFTLKTRVSKTIFLLALIFKRLQRSKYKTMNKLTLGVIIIILFFGIGFFSGRMSSKVEVVRTVEIEKAITNITHYTNYINTLEYVTNDNIPYEELKIMYNDLLKRSKDVSLSYMSVYREYDTLLVSYERLEKKANRKLYFLVGGDLQYNIDKNIIDIGVSAGMEYYNVAYTLGYLFFDRQISLNVSYRF